MKSIASSGSHIPSERKMPLIITARLALHLRQTMLSDSLQAGREPSLIDTAPGTRLTTPSDAKVGNLGFFP